MKKLVFIISILVCFSPAFAQVPDNGTYNANPNLNKFVGTWKWNDGSPTNEVTLMLKKVMYHFTGTVFDYYEEVLVGCHKYVQNGIVVEDDLALFPNLAATSTNIPLMLFEWNTPDIVFGRIQDYTKNKLEELRLTYNGSINPFLNWRLRIKEGTYPVDNFDATVTLPPDLTLSKQSN